MKKFLIACIIMVQLMGCSTPSKQSSMKKISADEVIRRLQIEDDDSFLLVLTTTECYSCDEYAKVVEQLQKEKPFDLYYIDINDEDKDKLDELKITLGEVITLPMTYYFEDGVLKPDNIKQNYIELETYREWLKLLKIY